MVGSDRLNVPWEEGGNGGTISQVTVLGDWDEEADPGQWWVVSQGSNGEGGKKEKKGKKRKQEQEGGTFRVAGGLLIRTREEAEAHLREALGEEDDGGDGDDGDDEGDKGGDKGGGKGGEVGGHKGGEKEGDTGGEKGGAGSKDEHRQPPPPPRRRGNLRVANREWGPRGVRGLIRLTGLIGLTDQQVTRRRPTK